MTELIIISGTAFTLVGAVIAMYQLFQIRSKLGKFLFWGEIGTIMTEHVLLGALWIVLLTMHALLTNADTSGLYPHDAVSIFLVLLIMAIVWGFAIRAHIWHESDD